MNNTFGELLKEIRMKEARMGLRAFAELIEMAPSNLSDIERNKKNPPAKKEKIDLMCDALGLVSGDSRRQDFYDLAANYQGRVPADVKEALEENKAIPILVRTVANKRLDDDKLKELTDYIQKHY